MAAKPVEPKTNGENELTMAELYNLILSPKDELKVDIKRVYGQFCMEPLHESRKWKSNGLSCLFE